MGRTTPSHEAEKLAIAVALKNLERALGLFVRALSHESAPVSAEAAGSEPEVRRLVCEAYATINYAPDDQVNESPVCLGVIGDSAAVIGRAEAVNAAKDELRERSQLTDLREFWARHDPKEPAIGQRIEEWQFDYNWRRPHGSLGRHTPVERLGELAAATPLREDVARMYDPANERLRLRDYRADRAMAKLWSARRDQERAAAAVATGRH